MLAPLSAHIPRYFFQYNKYWYVIDCVLEDGSRWELTRDYDEFYDLQWQLFKHFPEEAGQGDSARILPYIPGPLGTVNDAIASARREVLDEYLKKLLMMPDMISRHAFVCKLFQPKIIDPDIPQTMPEDYRISTASSSAGGHFVSQHLSHDQTNGNGDMHGSSEVQLQRLYHTRNQLSESLYMSGGIGESAMQRQPSSLTQASSTSNLPIGGDGSGNNGMMPSSGALRIKVFFGDDCIAIRVPNNISFAALHEKLKERLKVHQDIVIQYKDKRSSAFAELLSDPDLDVAIAGDPKLTLYVGYT